jgi:hypothetical protein
LILGIGVAVAIVGVAFYFAFPELKYIRGNTTCNPVPGNPVVQGNTVYPAIETNTLPDSNSNQSKLTSSCEVLFKTVTPEE